jgi:hypothetical protein
VSIDWLAFKLVDAEVTGDAGFVRSRGEMLYWMNGTPAPEPIEFPSAPIGLYSKVALDIDGQTVDNSWWITGHATVNGTNRPFEIYYWDSLAISLDTSIQLSPGQPATIPILIKLDQAFSQVDFTQFDLETDPKTGLLTLSLSTNAPYMATFLQHLTSSIVINPALP